MSEPHQRRKRDQHQNLRQAQMAAPPGSVVTDPTAPRSAARAVCYGPDGYEARKMTTPAELRAWSKQWPVTWIQVEGLGDGELIRELGAEFNLHPLALEDVVSNHQRPKVEAYEDHYYIVVREPVGQSHRESVQVSIFLGKGFVITFRSNAATPWTNVYQRIRQGMGRIRDMGADYLAYTLIDASLDTYFPSLERLGEFIERLEDRVISSPEHATIGQIHDLKHELLGVRRAVWPAREAINILMRDDLGLIGDETRMYLRDVHDHTFQIVELVESYREITSGLVEVYLTSVSNRTNEVMRVLTIIATLFIPLTFIAGLYGMNFSPAASPWNMPELNWYMGYPFALGLMTVFAVALLFFFWRKGWIHLPGHFGTKRPGFKERRRRSR